MNWLKTLLVTYGPRVLGSIAGLTAAKITEKTGISVDPATLVGIALAAYSAAHRATSAVVNKGDAATGRVAEAEKQASDTGSVVKVELDR